MAAAVACPTVKSTALAGGPGMSLWCAAQSLDG